MFAVGLVAVALVGVIATVAGPGGRTERAAAVTAGAPAVRSTTTDVAPITAVTTSSAVEDRTSTTVAPTTTTTSSAPTTTAAVPAPPPTTAPVTTAAPPAPTTAPPPPPPTPPRPPSPAERQRIARSAAIVAHTTGHRVTGLPSVDVLVAPELRPALDGITRPAAYRAAGCRQWVTETIAGPGTATSFGFSLTIERTCDRVPTLGGRTLPLTTGAYTVVTVGPAPTGVWWTVGLTSE